jgi:LysR family glycine cleavage system transcriptional activator
LDPRLGGLNRPHDWPTWLSAAGACNSGLKFENAALAYRAAVDQRGVMVAQLAFVSDDLVVGRLVAPFPQRTNTGGAYVLAYRSDHPKPERVQAFEE